VKLFTVIIFCKFTLSVSVNMCMNYVRGTIQSHYFLQIYLIS